MAACLETRHTPALVPAPLARWPSAGTKPSGLSNKAKEVNAWLAESRG